MADDHEVEPAVPVRVDRFGFVKQEQNSAEGLCRSRSASEYERYAFFVKRWLKIMHFLLCAFSLNHNDNFLMIYHDKFSSGI